MKPKGVSRPRDARARGRGRSVRHADARKWRAVGGALGGAALARRLAMFVLRCVRERTVYDDDLSLERRDSDASAPVSRLSK